MGRLWQLYNVHGNFEHLEPFAKALLGRAGLWDEFGAGGWGADGTSAMFQVSSRRVPGVFQTCSRRVFQACSRCSPGAQAPGFRALGICALRVVCRGTVEVYGVAPR